MRQTWRWFGPADTISPTQMRQAGVEGVVTALHHIPAGQVWSVEEIRKRQAELAGADPMGRDAGQPMAWEVVESLPVSEEIKRKGPRFAEHVAAYKDSLRNLVACGLEVICYNFMPILDWTRTELRRTMPHGGSAMSFDLVDFAMFDIHLLARAGAAEEHGPEIAGAAAERLAATTPAHHAELVDNIVKGLPGAMESWGLDELRAGLAAYDGISPERLFGNLVDFLSEVAPLAEELGLRLCCHPDDPPFPLMGLPRIMSTRADYARLMNAVDLPANGITFCTGSLGVRAEFDGPGFVRALGPRIHFAHLRNTTRHAPANGQGTSFYEAAHLEGDTDMAGTVLALMDEEARRREEGRADWQIPMRPDHGQDLLDDLERAAMPGYPLIGRMRGLAELRGIMAAHGARAARAG